jgi:hypothetical protein
MDRYISIFFGAFYEDDLRRRARDAQTDQLAGSVGQPPVSRVTNIQQWRSHSLLPSYPPRRRPRGRPRDRPRSRPRCRRR